MYGIAGLAKLSASPCQRFVRLPIQIIDKIDFRLADGSCADTLRLKPRI